MSLIKKVKEVSQKLEEFKNVLSIITITLLVAFFIFENISAKNSQKEEKIFKLKLEANNKFPDYRHTIETLLNELDEFYTQYDKLIIKYEKIHEKGAKFIVDNSMKTMKEEIEYKFENGKFRKKEFHINLTKQQLQELQKDDKSLYLQTSCTVQKIASAIENNARYDYYKRFLSSYKMYEKYQYEHTMLSKILKSYNDGIFDMANKIKNNSNRILKLEIKDPKVYKFNHERIKYISEIITMYNQWIELELNSDKVENQAKLNLLKKIKKKTLALANFVDKNKS